MQFKARYRTGSDTEFQLLTTHLEETAMYAELFSRKIGLPKAAVLTALTHDLGKGCGTWANYLEESRKSGRKGRKEDHGTAGGQYLYKIITKDSGPAGELIAQILAACVIYHHGPGLPDVIEPDGTARLYQRLNKSDAETHTGEAILNLDNSIKQKIDAILDENFIAGTMEVLRKLAASEIKQSRNFNLGLTARFLSSCLIDGDRRSSALFDKGIPATKDDAVAKADWKGLRECLENHLAELPREGKLNEIRGTVSRRCAEFAERADGIYTLTAATGAGKTLASLRYALARAESAGKDHIFIIAPYTSILDQNAAVIRGILAPGGKNGQIILEHHSNLEQSEKGEYFADSFETWNVPIIITTMVQFLETLFGYGTRKIRRMHQLTNSVIIFDEVQTLPLACTYLFNWAVRYLSGKANSSILLSTATQPGLDRLKPKYALPLAADNEIIPDIVQHFEELQRVELADAVTDKGRTLDEAAQFIENLPEKSILTVVNTRAQARTLYTTLSQAHPDWHMVHLSAGMCPAHRKQKIDQLKQELQNKSGKCVCISTRLIEAGVDIDFDGAVRFLAGFDSIIQTAGRCNRNGELKDSQGNPVNGKTWIINIVKTEEKIHSLPELKRGQEIMGRILREFNKNKEQYNNNLLHPDLIKRYFEYYYCQVPDELLKHKVQGRDETVLDLLSDNTKSEQEYMATAAKPLTNFRQSFATAWKAFEVISQDTIGVIVPFGNGDGIIKALFALPDTERCIALLQEAQQYSVNVYFNELSTLIEEGIVKTVPLNNGMEIHTVNEQYYDHNIGITREAGIMQLCNV